MKTTMKFNSCSWNTVTSFSSSADEEELGIWRMDKLQNVKMHLVWTNDECVYVNQITDLLV